VIENDGSDTSYACWWIIIICLHGGIIMVNVYGSDIPNLSKFVEDTIEAIDIYGTDIYDEDLVEE